MSHASLCRGLFHHRAGRSTAWIRRPGGRCGRHRQDPVRRFPDRCDCDLHHGSQTEGVTMQTKTPGRVVMLGLLATCALNACYQAKTPDQVAKDTAAAEDTATQNAANVEQHADDKLHGAQTV